VTKGKYAERATRRREDADVVATEEAYKRQIVRLTQERNDARTERDVSRAAHRKEVRLLQAQNREGTSHRVEALVREVNQLRAAADKARANLRSIVEKWERVGHRLTDHYVDEHGLSGIEATAMVLTMIGRPPNHGEEGHDGVVHKRIVIDEGHSMISGDVDKIDALQFARRDRARSRRARRAG
jgi:hypothetical protein